MTSEKITFQIPVTEADARLIYNWRNDPRTTVYWADTHRIVWDEHLQWFANITKKADERLLFALEEGEKVGVVRLSRSYIESETVAEVGIYLDPDLHGRGLGPRILSSLTGWCTSQDDFHLDWLVARVDKRNMPSRRSFEKAAYALTPLEIQGAMSVVSLLELAVAYRKGELSPTEWVDSQATHVVFILDL